MDVRTVWNRNLVASAHCIASLFDNWECPVLVNKYDRGGRNDDASYVASDLNGLTPLYAGSRWCPVACGSRWIRVRI